MDMQEPYELLITGQKGYASNQPVYNLILLGKDFKEDEAELVITHEILHILISKLDIFAYNTFDNAVISYTQKFRENIEGFNQDECLKGIAKCQRKKRK
jgi:Zn-dependent peptidase ImmA (M78 family)